VITVINANVAVTLLEQKPEKNFQALSGIRTLLFLLFLIVLEQNALVVVSVLHIFVAVY